MQLFSKILTFLSQRTLYYDIYFPLKYHNTVTDYTGFKPIIKESFHVSKYFMEYMWFVLMSNQKDTLDPLLPDLCLKFYPTI